MAAMLSPTVSMSGTGLFSVTSTVSSSQGTRAMRSSATTRRPKPGTVSEAADTFTARGKGRWVCSPWPMACTTVSTVHHSNSISSWLRAATSSTRGGEIGRPLASLARSRASAASTSPVRRSHLGWYASGARLALIQSISKTRSFSSSRAFSSNER